MALNIVKNIDNRVAVKNVLMSVSDKTGLETFVPALVKACPGVKIYSTGGTYTKVKEILGADADGLAQEDQADVDAQLLGGIDLAEVGVRDRAGDAVALDFADQREAGLLAVVERDDDLRGLVAAHFALERVRVELQQLGLAVQRREHGGDEAGPAEAAGRARALDRARLGAQFVFLCHVWPFFGLV